MLQEAGPQFERTTGHKLNVSVDLAAVVVRRVNSGEDFDIAVAAPAQIEGLVKDGKLIADTRTDLTRSGIGVEVRKGAPKPDISSVEAFKKAMRDAKSVGYLKVGTSGLMVAAMLERIGLTEALKSKIVLPDDDVVSKMVAEGKRAWHGQHLADSHHARRRSRRSAAGRVAVLHRVFRRGEREVEGPGCSA